MKKLLAIFFVLYSILSWTQNKVEDDFTIQRYTSTDGYKLSNPINGVYDKLGYLWILGNSTNENKFQIEDQKYLLQRFDGVNFYDVFLPFTVKGVANANFVEYDNFFLLILLLQNGDALFFKIDLYSLQVEPHQEYEKLKTNDVEFKSGPYIINDQKIFLFQKQNHYQLYKLVDDRLLLTDSLEVKQPLRHPKSTMLNTKAQHVYLFFASKETYLVNDQGKFVKSFSLNDAKKLGLKEIPKEIYFRFVSGEYTYYTNLQEDLFFKVNNETLIPEKIPGTYPFVNKKVASYHVGENQYSGIFKTQFGYQLEVYDITQEDQPLKFNSTYSVKDFKATTKVLGKYMTIFNDNQIDNIWFSKKAIKTYVKGKSIRFVRQIKDQEYLISTDENGIFKVNTLTKTEEEIHFYYKGKELQILYPRSIIFINDHYYITDRDAIIKTDNNFKVVNKFNHHFKAQAIKIGDTIFRGGLESRGILKFDLKTQRFSQLQSSYEFSIREFASTHNILFALTEKKGVLKSDNGTVKLYVPENEKPQNLLSITYDKSFGLLIGTKQGKVYVFNEVANTFSLLYEDNLSASVVGMVSDSSKTLWLNTYAGIVSFNPNTKEFHRFTKEDGIFELEGNRHSTTVDSYGNIIMGSYRGVSIFNPDELKKTTLNTTLHFTSLSFFDHDTEEWKEHIAPGFLAAVKKIELPYHNQRFNAKIALLNQEDVRNYKLRYRLVNKKKEIVNPWNTTQFGNELIFTNLAPNDYRLEVDLLDSVDKRIGDTLFLEVTSNPIFYQTWWFYLVSFIIASSILLYFVKQYKDKQNLYAANKIALNEARIKETMMLEIHHRIKNNLQIVSGLLGLQAYQTDNEELKEKLKESQQRIETIAGIHNILYSGDNQKAISLQSYFDKIINFNKTLFNENIQFITDIADITLNMDKAIPLALILNELISNSNKHAFKNSKSPEININFKKSSKDWEFVYRDNGSFQEFSSNTQSIGMKIIQMMSKQLKGNTEIRSDNGFEFVLMFRI